MNCHKFCIQDLREQNDGLQSIAAGHTSNHAQQQVEELDQLRKEIGLMRSQSAQHSVKKKNNDLKLPSVCAVS